MRVFLSNIITLFPPKTWGIKFSEHLEELIKFTAKNWYSFSTLYFLSPVPLIIRVTGYLTYPWIYGSPSFNSYRYLSASFRLRVKDFEYICDTKTRELPFWFSTIKADFILSENSQLAIFATKYGGVLLDRLPLVSELFCTICASIFLAISSLDASVRTFDISSIPSQKNKLCLNRVKPRFWNF